MKKIALFLPNWVGDAVMATPAIRALRHGLGDSVQMIAVGRPGAVAVLEGLPAIDRAIAYKPRSRGKNPNRFPNRFEVVRMLRKESLDGAILFPNSFGIALMAWCAGAKRRVGYARDGRSLLLTDRVAVKRQGRKEIPISAVDYYMALAEQMGCWSSHRKMELALTENDEKLGDQLWSQVGFKSDVATVVINSSGAYGGAKLWPQEYVIELAKRLVEQPVQVLLHCGPDEKVAADAVIEAVSHPNVKSMGVMADLPLGLTKAVMKRAAVVVSTDSGPRHIAVAMDKPVISLFGPTEPVWTTTYNVPEVTLEEQLECRACWARTCPLGHHKCMRNITVDRVFHKVRSILDKRANHLPPLLIAG